MAFSGLGNSESVDQIHMEIVQFTPKANMAEAVWSVLGLFSLGWYVVRVWEETERKGERGRETEHRFVNAVCWEPDWVGRYLNTDCSLQLKYMKTFQGWLHPSVGKRSLLATIIAWGSENAFETRCYN